MRAPFGRGRATFHIEEGDEAEFHDGWTKDEESGNY